MWKYVTRRIRDTFERSANHFDKRSSAVINTTNNNISEDQNKNTNSPCCWFISRKCWNSFQSENDTNSKRWNFDHLNRTWIGAITWSSALVFGWYTSQLIHLKCKKQSKNNKIQCLTIKNNCLFEYLPFLSTVPKENLNPLDLNIQLNKALDYIPPVVHLVSNDHNGENKRTSTSSTSSTSSEDDLGEVLNSIENRLGLAAIENGHHQDGLNLLRSAANRNHAPALYNLGLCYELGLGVKVDEKIAMEHYRSAAALQHPDALYNLGIFYGQGRGGLAQDEVTASRLLRLAAVQGHENAITALKYLKEDLLDDSGKDLNPQSDYTKHSDVIPTHSKLFIGKDLLHTINYNYKPVVF